MTSTDKELRERFERWAAERGWNLSPYQNNCGIVVPNMYGHPSVKRCWEAWMAAYAEAQAEIEALRKDVGALRNLAIGYRMELISSGDYEVRISEAEFDVNKFIDMFHAAMQAG